MAQSPTTNTHKNIATLYTTPTRGTFFCAGGLNQGQPTLLQPVSQVGAIDLERVANFAGANLSGIDPVDEGVTVDVDVLGSFPYADVPWSGAKFLNCLHAGLILSEGPRTWLCCGIKSRAYKIVCCGGCPQARWAPSCNPNPGAPFARGEVRPRRNPRALFYSMSIVAGQSTWYTRQKV
jgi:hypothetical protein